MPGMTRRQNARSRGPRTVMFPAGRFAALGQLIGSSVTGAASGSPTACPALLVRTGSDVGGWYPLTAEHTVLGRDHGCEVVLDNTTVSRRHAVIERRQVAARVRDLGSRNGLFVNGRPCSRSSLEHGDILQIGNIQLVFLQQGTGPS